MKVMMSLPVRGGYVLVDAGDRSFVEGRQWRMHPKGYVRDSAGAFLHRLLLGLSKGDARQGDHRNRCRNDCRRSNLRVVTGAQNRQNRRGHGRSGVRGVAWSRGKWQVEVGAYGRKHYLGRFDDREEAGRVASAFRRAHLPFSEEAVA